jgi:pimeloyl-ACP methyl ester carboxylesterase
MTRANPLFSYVDVEGAGHVVTVDKPQEFIAATRAFLGVV